MCIQITSSQFRSSIMQIKAKSKYYCYTAFRHFDNNTMIYTCGSFDLNLSDIFILYITLISRVRQNREMCFSLIFPESAFCPKYRCHDLRFSDFLLLPVFIRISVMIQFFDTLILSSYLAGILSLQVTGEIQR